MQKQLKYLQDKTIKIYCLNPLMDYSKMVGRTLKILQVLLQDFYCKSNDFGIICIKRWN